MRKRKNEKAAQGAVVSKLWRGTNNGTAENGLGSNLTGGRFVQADLHLTASRYECADGSGRRPLSANMPVPLRSKRCERSGSREHRRITAAPALIRAVAFLFDGIRTHGLIAPALYRFCGLMPCGRLLRLPFPVLRSANPHGVALLIAEGGGFEQFNIGACHE